MKIFENMNLGTGYSIGFCLGNFLTEFESFLTAPNETKIISLVSLSLAVGPQFVKIYPNLIKFAENYIKISNFGLIFDGLNVLYALVFESLSIYNFSQNHKSNITLKYGFKRGLKLCTGFGCSILGSLALKGVLILIGVSLAPWATIVIGVVGGIIIGIAGNKIIDKIYDSEKTFGKDEFILTSANLYYKYIPKKYREKGNNPQLHWNKTYLCNNVKSYIIECIVDEVELTMRVMNIPKDVHNLPECLGYYENKDKDLNSNNSDDNTSIDSNAKNLKKLKIVYNDKFIGNLIIPYEGIKENAYKIDFIIYGINKENISEEEWESKDKDKLIEIGFVLSVY